ncbi:MAG: MerC family mercury resistance protein [Xanthomonadales bacterium]|nr:MerC family mercury resistance protein [Xanthomonadales bacterium]
MQRTLDRVGMLLALGCALHCLMVPVMFALLPGLVLALHSFQDPLRPLAIGLLRLQALEGWLVAVALAWAAAALVLGWRRHRRLLPGGLALLGAGSFLLALSRLFPGRWLHAGLLALGGVLLALAHWSNLRAFDRRPGRPQGAPT